jgi:hypothetical protein
MPNTELETVSVTVPRDRVGDLYQFVAGLHETEGAAARVTNGSELRRGWTAEDADVAAAFYRSVSSKAKSILDVLMDVPQGQTRSGEELARMTGLDKGPYGVAGSLSSVGKAAGKLHRALPYVATPGETGGSSSYSMPRVIAELFRTARASQSDEVDR